MIGDGFSHQSPSDWSDLHLFILCYLRLRESRCGTLQCNSPVSCPFSVLTCDRLAKQNSTSAQWNFNKESEIDNKMSHPQSQVISIGSKKENPIYLQPWRKLGSRSHCGKAPLAVSLFSGYQIMMAYSLWSQGASHILCYLFCSFSADSCGNKGSCLQRELNVGHLSYFTCKHFVESQCHILVEVTHQLFIFPGSFCSS